MRTTIMTEVDSASQEVVSQADAGLPPELPNKLARIVLLALEEVLGRNGLNAVLNLARLPHFIAHYPPADFTDGVEFAQISGLLAAIDEMYGPRGGRMLALRAGRTCFKHGIKDFGGLVGLGDLLFRILPLNLRARLGLEVVVEILNRYSDHLVSLHQEEDAYFVVAERCGACWERRTTYPACALVVGLLQEGLYWISGGHLFAVEETTCMAMGDATCTFRVDKAR